ncbi:MAG TPA: type II toxin-antitoxin system RelE/ParE family toxin [Gemmatimonadales bacterium]|nr:type II toxin-antitoxin system RelE/ParE family toxin [Gemmatimonadales bacterium]
MAETPPRWTIEEYALPGREKPILTFLLGLVQRDKRDAIALLQLIQERGNQIRPPHSKLVETGLFELRGQQIRIFYMFLPGRRIVLLDGIVKKQDRIPQEVLKRVRGYRQAVEAAARKSAGGA